ncbi:uncharacterized protein SPPG_04513 [Spizellomyces punctatus DAOM BR117]|uniref:Uncharacterized protein n=1 Tax=Spizellomyces punctatus (strain DAOM BR117) TaxID=645134 RepID=A0A0L0HGL2_SPIPD|nr:uncharacterized protein SPPG_04513 [Spizellomyces punctatus DAOM BR117]KND00172.1 hypothetical protein SPPG_04513 [Spizellomyces punctatus DAOM BR117]|eukprot:XP_016608211.1 hypothetical protein SPPG_04513 [Spizellomyces punctatus DAOM BR117]
MSLNAATEITIPPTSENTITILTATTADTPFKKLAATLCAKNGVRMEAQRIGPDSIITMQGARDDVTTVVEELRLSQPQMTVKEVEGDPLFYGVIIRVTVNHGGIFKKASSGDLDHALPIELPPSYQESMLSRVAVNAASHTVGSVPLASSFALATTAIISAVGVPSSSLTSASIAAGSQFLERLISKKPKKPAFDEKATLQAFHAFKMEHRSITTERVRLAEIDLERDKEKTKLEQEKTKLEQEKTKLEQEKTKLEQEKTKQLQLKYEQKQLQLKYEHERFLIERGMKPS